jgi:Tol biopolymer transport system component
MIRKFLALAAVGLLAGCGGGGGGAGGDVEGKVVLDPPSIVTTRFPLADITLPYDSILAATGSPDIAWSVSGGSLPTGVSLSGTGTISGTPTVQGQFPVTIMAVGPGGRDIKGFTLTVRPRTSLISINSTGQQGNAESGAPPAYGGEAELSGDGRFVVFNSIAGNLVPGDTNGKRDVFVHDRETGEVSPVSVGVGGAPADGESPLGSISEDGNIIAYHSFAGNLVTGDQNGNGDVFVLDRRTHLTTRVSIKTVTGEEGICDVPPIGGLDCTSYDPHLSYDGSLVVFGSTFSNLVPGDANGQTDIFVHDRSTKLTERVSVGLAGLESDGFSGNPGISADGRYVVFESKATTLAGVGQDTNGFSDIFVHDRTTGQTTRVSVGAGGVQGNDHSFTPSISRDGRIVAFWSLASNLVINDSNGVADVFVVDWQSPSPILRRVSVDQNGVEGNGESRVPMLSRDGRFVVYESDASNLIGAGQDTNGHPDIFVVDTQPGAVNPVRRVSVDGDGAEAVGGASFFAAISADGRFVSYTSFATNLASNDLNGVGDVFVSQRP